MEIFPIVAGLASGGIVGVTTGRWQVWRVIAVAIGLGVAATVVTGEWRTSWLYLLVDIPLVAVTAVAGCLMGRMARKRAAQTGPLRP